MDALARPGQQRGGLSHEVHAAKDNVGGVHIGNAAGQLQRVAHNVAMAHHGVILVMVPHDAELRPELLFDGGNGPVGS